MATTLALAMRASMSASGVVSGANQAAGAMDKMGKQAAKTASDVNVLKNIAIGGALIKSVNTIASALQRAAEEAIGFAESIGQSVDDTSKLAKRLGVSVESLQSLQLAAKMSGINDLTPILQKMAITLGQAATGAEPAVKAFEAIGLSSKELASLSADEQFEAIAAKLSAIQDPAARAAAAVKIFGEQGISLLPMLGQNLDETRERMERLGIVLSGDQTEAIESMNDALTLVQATFQGIIGQVVGNLAPVVESLANEILSMVESFNSVSGEGGTGIANAITEAMFDVIEFMAGVFDKAAVNFASFGEVMSTVGDIFQRVGNVFMGIAETFRAIWNAAQLSMNEIFSKLGRGLQAAGEFFGSDDLKNFGQFWAEDLERQNAENSKELLDAATNAAKAFSRAFTGESEEPGEAGPLQSAVQGLRANFRDSQTPEAKAAREAARKAKQDAERAAREAAAKALADQKAAAEMKKAQDDAAKKAAAVQEKIDAKEGDIADFQAERAGALQGKNNEALQANDVRSSEGISQFLALATGREDPAIAEYRKQTQKLEELKAELRALQQEKVEILGGANN